MEGSTILTAKARAILRPVQRAPRGEQVEREGGRAHRDRELGGARHLARGQRGIGQRAIGDELALRDQDHARHREHQHQRQPQQRIDRAIGDAVLDRNSRIVEFKTGRSPSRSRPRRWSGLPPVEMGWRIFDMVDNNYQI